MNRTDSAGPGGPAPLSAGDLDAVLSLCRLSLPDESLSIDDLEGVLFADEDGRSPSPPALVSCVDAGALGVTDSSDGLAGVAGVSMTEVAGHRSAHLQLLVVHPARRRRGVAGALVQAAESWAVDRGAATMTVGAGAPFYLFTGVDSRWTDALCSFEGWGYERTGAELDLVCPTRPSHATAHGAAGSGVVVDHVVGDGDVAALIDWVRSEYPHWQAEFARAAEVGSAVVARDGSTGAVTGAAAHSVSRFGVVGPVAVDPSARRRGVGARLMAEVLSDLSVAGLRTAEIAWTSTVRFYARTCSARVGRTSVVLRRDLGAGR